MMGPFGLLAATYMVGRTLRDRKAADRAIALRKAEARSREERARKAKAKAAREVEERRVRALRSAEERARKAEQRARAAEARAAEAPAKAEPKPRPLVPLPKPPRPVAVTKSTPKQDKAVANKVKTQPEPWPAVVPSGLPPFPGSGWVPDRPERPEVIARAVQLIKPLHARGVGASVVEHIGGRWVGFIARMHAGSKRAVEAYRPKEATPKPVAVVTPVVTKPAPKPAAKPAPKPAAKPAPKGRPTLREGSVGSDVVALQKMLGFQGSDVDGKFGPKTRARVVAFQKARKLEQDGIVGPKTWAALEKSGTKVFSRSTVRQGSSGPDVVAVQEALGVSPADGIFGPATAKAVRTFQASRGLGQDAVVGPKTWEALGYP